ncbi:LCP family protein [Streptomyces sp. SCSIO ZS0520]|uniref:LCP family protein n=1 Tax=Streptomyces sp. SCSIO ZS0520 TaxID=2892996 RepID=UPI0021D8BA80|nr:LCP family protein [Streptomyces sp. SCSIO ZS0520]
MNGSTGGPGDTGDGERHEHDGAGGTGGGPTGPGGSEGFGPADSWAGRPGPRAGRKAPSPYGAGATPTGQRAVRRRRWIRRTAIGGAFLVLVAGGAGWALYEKLNGNITADEAAARELARYEKERPTALVRGAQNILLIGSDSRAGRANARYGRDNGTERSDTTILLHLAADRRSATAMSIPRDLMTQVPGCRGRDGKQSRPMFAMFNYAFQKGGSACTIRTVEKMTDIRIDHHMVIDFGGFKKVVDAVDGVEVCLPKAIDDEKAHLRLAAGRRQLDGEQALGYVRARKSLGNGSDTDRMDRQQRFLGALVHKVQSNDVLLNPGKLYPVLDAATSSLTTDPGLASLRDLYQLVRGMRKVPSEKVQFLTVPRRSYVYDANRDQLVEPQAGRLFSRLRHDRDLAVSEQRPREEEPREQAAESGSGRAEKRSDAPEDPSSPAPTFRGNTAEQDAC